MYDKSKFYLIFHTTLHLLWQNTVFKDEFKLFLITKIYAKYTKINTWLILKEKSVKDKNVKVFEEKKKHET